MVMALLAAGLAIGGTTADARGVSQSAAVADGGPDLSFGGGSGATGFVTPPNRSLPDGFVPNPRVSSAIDADGRIVLVATNINSAAGMVGMVQRFMPDGSPDPLWNHGLPVQRNQAWFEGVAVTSGGRTVIAGADASAGIKRATIFAFDAFGAPDPSFGSGGMVSITPPPWLWKGFDHALRIAAGGGYVVASLAAMPTGAVAGQPDATAFVQLDDTGTVVPPLANFLTTSGQGVAVDAADRFYLQDTQMSVTRIGPVPGTFDFNVNVGALVQDFAIDASSRLVVVDNLFVVHRYLPTGAVDPSFGTLGSQSIATTCGPSGTASVKTEPDLSVVVALFGGSGGWCQDLVRLGPSGALVPTFQRTTLTRVTSAPPSLAVGAGRILLVDMPAVYAAPIAARAFNDATVARPPLPAPPVPHDAVRGQIERLYRVALGRRPDYFGLAGWETLRYQGASLITLAAAFVSSPEYLARYGPSLTDTEFITALYVNALGRAPDPAGLAAWVDLLATGRLTRPWAVLGFSESAEMAALSGTVSQSGADGMVERLYRAYFTRPPDPAGRQFWLDHLAAGTPLWIISEAFAQSVEFAALYGSLSDASFVSLLYRNVLGRPPDADGAAFWLSLLSRHVVGRGGVMLGFSESAEFVQLTGTSLPW